MSVCVVGSVALDTVKTPFGEAEDALGGSASFFSVAARHFTPVSLVAVVGEDFPSAHLELFRSRDIDLSGLEVAKGKTFRWAGEYGFDLNSRTTLDTQLNVFADFQPKLTEAHRASEFLFLANIHPQLQLEVFRQVTQPKMTVLDTMNLWIESTPGPLKEILQQVDVVLLNDEEARMLTGESGLLRAARKVLDLGPSLIVVKKGEHGALVHGRDFMFSAPVFPLEEVFDPTGAGDTFAGGFLGHLAACGDPWSEREIRRAAIYGTVMASFTVEAFSLNRLVEATRTEIDQRFQALKRLSHFDA